MPTNLDAAALPLPLEGAEERVGGELAGQRPGVHLAVERRAEAAARVLVLHVIQDLAAQEEELG